MNAALVSIIQSDYNKLFKATKSVPLIKILRMRLIWVVVSHNKNKEQGELKLSTIV